ncbi:PEP/pyruvate-binding domain-containing protein [Rarobacter faecitabidus]|uniref:Pyruvate phosphate dikinase-like enzyme n=1 Tax=Rarobacter faecitabidus TaxID=13243 RepID=A0A542ZWY1_RARFA|nr:PEP/pyruvate-binding domain-containing protein [Rarobacter faecitabidus]TQL64809.1 pyruvate phosphate dikinase-like enzyme [Rarobacter faecitabidus]
MPPHHRISTGHQGVDAIVDGLRIGDNVVWQTSDLADYREMVGNFVAQARMDGRRIVYIRFAAHEPVVDDMTGIELYHLDPAPGFESFASTVHQIITREGIGVYYVFDSLTDLLDRWYSDLMVLNFFKVTCPYLYDLDTVAYFCLLRGKHTFSTIAGIRETTQLLFDLYNVEGQTYIHTLKAADRYAPTMYFPHRVAADRAEPVTASEETSRLFGQVAGQREPLDRWRTLISDGSRALHDGDVAEQQRIADTLARLLLGRSGRMVALARQQLSLQDLLAIADREIGTGFIGGKSVGMLTAGAIAASVPSLARRLEAHDSFYLGSDLFLTYIVANGWWREWMAQKTEEGYYEVGARLHDRLAHGQFPQAIRERFLRLLEYYGQSPIIVRSSSLLEDNFGNAFAGKYESTFCANQGTPEDRLRAFENAVRSVYASSMSEEALTYRERRNLSTSDEQMAVLVQRVSGDHHGELFFPHAGGVGNSHNLYVWGEDIDPAAGALRLVIGLGTRAVDHLTDDYARVVTLDHPLRSPFSLEDAARYAQRKVDVLNLRRNALLTVPLTDVQSLPMDWSLFLSLDREQLRRLRELGRSAPITPLTCDFAGLLHSEFAAYMRELMSMLAAAYEYPVDIEFTVNLSREGEFRVGLVQCRPLQTRGLGDAIEMPDEDSGRAILRAAGGFMGGNVRLPIDVVVLVRPQAYLALGQQERYSVARELGEVNRALAGQRIMYIGPGRWGTSTTELGVPVHFAEINNAAALVEVTDPAADFSPDLSFGSHFFLDLVESNIFFIALDQAKPDALFAPALVTEAPNLLASLVPGTSLEHVITVARLPGLTLYSDVVSQRVACL